LRIAEVDLRIRRFRSVHGVDGVKLEFVESEAGTIRRMFERRKRCNAHSSSSASSISVPWVAAISS